MRYSEIYIVVYGNKSYFLFYRGVCVHIFTLKIRSLKKGKIVGIFHAFYNVQITIIHLIV